MERQRFVESIITLKKNPEAGNEDSEDEKELSEDDSEGDNQELNNQSESDEEPKVAIIYD